MKCIYVIDGPPNRVVVDMDARAQLLLNFPMEESFAFSGFVADGNHEVLSALQNLHHSTEHYSYLWGASGSGKTHLLQAVCRDSSDCVYIPLRLAAQGSSEVLETLDAFRIVCLDDVESILASEDWERRLFALFNQIQEQSRYLLISASVSPRQLPVKLLDLASRLNWGVAYRLQELQDTDKAEALRQRARARGFELSDEVLNYLLVRSARDMHALFRLLDQMDQMSLQEKRRITVPFLREIMGG